MSDHDVMYAEIDIKPVRHKQNPRKIPLYKKAQGSYLSWKTWKVMGFDNLDSRPGKSWNVCPGHGKSWKVMLANTVCSRPNYYSGLSEM